MSSQTSSPSSWHYTALTVLAGVGAGYLLGVVSGRWIWKAQWSRRPHRSSALQSQGQASSSSSSSLSSSLVSAIGELTAEVGRLREVVAAAGLTVTGRSYSRRSMNTVDSTADFVSARGDSDSDADFFDTEEPEKNEVDQQLAEFDELGKRTLESQEVCSNLIEKLRSAMEEREDDVELLWRLSRVLVHSSMHHEKRDEKDQEKQLLSQAAEHARKALDLSDESWQAHQWYAIAIGSVVKFEGTQDKINRGHEYKEHIDRAIELSPEEPILHHLNGRWCLEVAGLSWLEKKAAAALFATPPEASYEQALSYFMKSEELSPGTWKANMLMVAKCHLKCGDTDTAVDWLNKAEALPTVTTEDETSQEEIESLLEQYGQTE